MIKGRHGIKVSGVPLPADDVALIQEYVDELNSEMPPEVRTQLRYELVVDRNAATIRESRPADPAAPDGAWFEVECARLRFTRPEGWTLYWPDRNSAFHVYDHIDPSSDVRPLLQEIHDDPTGIFFG